MNPAVVMVAFTLLPPIFAAVLTSASAEVYVPVVIALLTGGGIGSIVSARVAARKNNLEELRGIIAEQQQYIDRLEERVDKLEDANAKLRGEMDALRKC